jgi:hypothetical protein
LGLYKGIADEGVLDRAESPAHAAIRDEESKLIADMELETTQTNKLERAGEGSMTIYYQQIVLT